MATTYTDNLHLGLQLDKTDYLNWDLIQQNWQKIDEAVAGGASTIAISAALNAIESSQTVNAVEEE